MSLITISKAQSKLAGYMRTRRLDTKLTQEGLAERSGVKLRTLRKFEQQSLISLESFLKLAMTLGCLEDLVNAAEPSETKFTSIDDVLKGNKIKTSKKGWRK
ncbi:MAG: XRE family transcriptional regulator [Piscirickettsiaceae bacterium]|nr:MAG: XRE family transcriptional regulator [Piscirickettsiaceae bacterium]